MKHFTQLYMALDATTKTGEKTAALQHYFHVASPADAAWAVYFLTGQKLKRLVPTRVLAGLACEVAGIPDWLFDECYAAVGDLAETIALLLPPPADRSELPLHVWVQQRLLTLRDVDDQQRAVLLRAAWQQLDDGERFVLNKLITGEFRVGVSQRLVTRALAEVSGIEAEVIAHRLMGDWQPSAEFFRRLISPDTGDAELSRPYPFFLAHPIEVQPAELGDVEDWQTEWKWDGIRAQLIRREGRTFLWSRGEELITERFPEIEQASVVLPDGTVLDGELLGWVEDRPLAFGQLQQRIGRKNLTKRILSQVPAAMLVFDLLEVGGCDVRREPLAWRRRRLEDLFAGLDAAAALRLSPVVTAESWDELAELRQQSRQRGTEGFMLKRRDSAYGVGRPRGDWWKWKIEPYTVDAVLTYAQPGSGRRASLYTDYTFGLWDGAQLVTFAKAYSGLTDSEIREVDRFVRDHTEQRFGPVCQVRPELVFELAFEDIRRSSRHKSGLAVRFPRIVRWRRDKRPEQADSLQRIRKMLPEL